MSYEDRLRIVVKKPGPEHHGVVDGRYPFVNGIPPCWCDVDVFIGDRQVTNVRRISIDWGDHKGTEVLSATVEFCEVEVDLDVALVKAPSELDRALAEVRQLKVQLAAAKLALAIRARENILGGHDHGTTVMEQVAKMKGEP